MAQHAGRALEHEPGVGLAGEQVGEVVEPADGVDHPAASAGSTSSAAPNGRHGVSTSRLPSYRVATSGSSSYVPTARVSTPSQPAGLAGQPAEREAVAVALRDRDQARGGVGDRAQVAAPAVAVDGEGETHRAPPHVQVERRVERPVERQVPLADVLDGLAAGADLELDQPDVRVVGVEGVGDAAQVVDVGAGGDRVADHRPLDGVGAADLALLGGGGAVGVPRVGADPDRDGGGDQGALVAGGVEPDPVGVLGAERLDHGAEVGQRARREVVALGGVHVEVVEGLEVGLDVDAASSDLDALLGGLLDVAPPELVHPGEHVGLGATGERDLEDVLRLAGGEAALDGLRPPAELGQLGDDAGAGGGRARWAAGRRGVVRRGRRCPP